jgi:formylglycine-generating enzyme required for sulfatase activity
MLADMSARTGITMPIYPHVAQLAASAGPRKPVTGIDWYVARAYCRYLGKQLPTSQEWVKAMRGGEVLPGGSVNPHPNRNFPFAVGDPRRLANLDPDAEIADVGSHPGDVSPYGVLDLTGNAQEWTATSGDEEGIRIVRGGGTADGSAEQIVDFMAIANPRVATQPLFALGVRCAIRP